MNAFEFDAKKYRQASGLQKDWGRSLLADMALRGDERVLDLGCGEGTLTAELAQRVPRGSVVGIDASAAMVKAAQGHACGNLRFVRMDINAIEFCGEFDIVFSNAALHWVKDHRRLLANIRRALRPGGYLRAGFGAGGNSPTFVAAVREAMAEGAFVAAFGGFEWPWYMPTMAEYEPRIPQAGFAEWKLRVENNDRYFSDADQMTRWMDQPCLVPFLSALGESMKRPFRDEAVRRVLERPRQPDGRHFEAFRRLHVWAKA